MLIDTHCHIHDKDFPDLENALAKAEAAGVGKFICVGTDLESSKRAVEFAKQHKDRGAFAAIGIHPHEASHEEIDNNLSDEVWTKFKELATEPEVVAIGEFGFDFFYHDRDMLLENQKKLVLKHLELANQTGLPLILHIREAFEAFFEVIADYPNLTGVVHSFSDSRANLERILELPNRFYIGLNGIMTFTKDEDQLAAAREVPAKRLVLETDSPYLTPNPIRGTINSIHNVKLVADFLAKLRGESTEELVAQTTENATKLFRF